MMTEAHTPITGDHLKAWGNRPGPHYPALIDRANVALSQGAEPIEVLGEPGCEVPRGRSGKACRVDLTAAA